MYLIVSLTAIIITLGFGLYISLRGPHKDSIFLGISLNILLSQ